MEINNNLCDTSYRTKIWKMVYKKEKETLDMDMDEIHILKNILCRLIKVYELVVIFSSLTCGALIGISHTNNKNKYIIIIYDTLRGLGIILSSLGSINGLVNNMILIVLPKQFLLKYLTIFMKYANVPLFTSILSIFSLMICSALHFHFPILIALLPFSIISFILSIYIYIDLRKNLIHFLIEK